RSARGDGRRAGHPRHHRRGARRLAHAGDGRIGHGRARRRRHEDRRLGEGRLMPLPAISLKEAKRRIGAIETALKAGHRPSTQPGRGPTAMGVAADALSMPRSTLQASLSRIERLHGLRPDWSLWQAPKAKPIAKAKPQEPVEDRTLQRLRDENAELRRKLTAADRTANADEDLRAALFGLARMPIAPKRWNVAPRSAGGPGVPVLFTSDFQWGETVDRDEVDGINEYNIAI